MAEPTFTVYIRLPISRGEFVDPPPIHWDAVKDDELWSIISGAAQTEIDSVGSFVPTSRCPAYADPSPCRAARFDVTVAFLLQQVAYLTDRHAAQLRAQVRKATAAAAVKTDPSASGHARTASALSIRRDSPLPHSGGPGTPVTTSLLRPNISRNASNSTAVQSPRLASAQAQRRRLSSLPIESTTTAAAAAPVARRGAKQSGSSADDDEDDDDDDASESDSDSDSLPAQSRIIRRPPHYKPSSHRDGAGDFGGAAADNDDDTDTDAEPAFGQQQQHQQPSSQDLGSTLRGDPGARRRAKGKHTSTATHRSETSDSSATSSPAFAAGPAAVQGGGDRSRTQQGAGHAGPLSPRRTAELSGKSPSRREGSDGTPSMGSSFSDLDAHITTQTNKALQMPRSRSQLWRRLSPARCRTGPSAAGSASARRLRAATAPRGPVSAEPGLCAVCHWGFLLFAHVRMLPSVCELVDLFFFVLRTGFSGDIHVDRRSGYGL
ncbi:uncharacterized protein VDAG_02650 [Verticillium dahliae VdLs.17]|uniref:Autophagy-related protein 29 n=1 Tax=Verticillium dahliae (strain VdLs.17 / ATCC MYA-4575 / FGSC 10137) TaxID=498257 RepID=G2WYG8_VERDV|nr:uncharacterized protein VDAG_02650 [Verticillium dahliae VdLs.17]EGY21126.1 hypothetical protein VDAG_02650 [Verticillium dahliae VdLs.17]